MAIIAVQHDRHATLGALGASTRPMKQAGTTALGNADIELNGTKKSQVTELSTKQRAGRRQEVMWNITQRKNLAGCHRWPRGGEVGISYTPEGPSEYVGLQNSNSRFCSPLASLQIFGKKRIELAIAVKNHLAAGGTIAMVVGTVPHGREMGLDLVLKGLKQAHSSMVTTGKWREDRDRYGITHAYFDYEHTHSFANGHHPHRQGLLFLDRHLSEVEVDALESSMFGRWTKGAVKGGLKAPSRDRGLMVTQVASTWGSDAAKTASYLAKGMADEMTGSASKSGKGGSRNAFQMLDDLADQADEGQPMEARTVAAYREFEEFFFDLRSSWSRGAKKALGVDHITVEQAREMEEELFALSGTEPPERSAGDQRMVAIGIAASEWRKIASQMADRQRVLDAMDSAKTFAEAQRNGLTLLGEFGVSGVPRCIPMAVTDLDEVLPTHAQRTVSDLHKHLLSGQPQLIAS